MNEDQKDTKAPVSSGPASGGVVSDVKEQPKAETPDQIAERVIAEWELTIRNTPLSRNTVSLNCLQAKLPILKALIAKEITK